MRARVGSLWVVTGVVHIGLGGRLIDMIDSPPESRFFNAKGWQADPLFLEEHDLNQLQTGTKTKPNGKWISGVFLCVRLVFSTI